MTQAKHVEVVTSVIKDLEKILSAKGEKYSNAILDRPQAHILIHIQDKIDRIVDEKACIKEVVSNDDIIDLAGYCVLYLTWLSLHDPVAYKAVIESAIACK